MSVTYDAPPSYHHHAYGDMGGVQPLPPDLAYRQHVTHVHAMKRDERELEWFRAAYDNDYTTMQVLLTTDEDFAARMLDQRGICTPYQQSTKTCNGLGEQFTTFYYVTYYGNRAVDSTAYAGRRPLSAALARAGYRRGFTALEYAAMQQADDVIRLLLEHGASEFNRLREVDTDSAQYLSNFIDMFWSEPFDAPPPLPPAGQQ